METQFSSSSGPWSSTTFGFFGTEWNSYYRKTTTSSPVTPSRYMFQSILLRHSRPGLICCCCGREKMNDGGTDNEDDGLDGQMDSQNTTGIEEIVSEITPVKQRGLSTIEESKLEVWLSFTFLNLHNTQLYKSFFFVCPSVCHCFCCCCFFLGCLSAELGGIILTLPLVTMLRPVTSYPALLNAHRHLRAPGYNQYFS